MGMRGDINEALKHIKNLAPLNLRELVIFSASIGPLEENGFIDEDEWGADTHRGFLTQFAPWLANDGQWEAYVKLWSDTKKGDTHDQ